MVSVLDFINSKLDEAGIPYEFGEWSNAVSYPYFVGNFNETDYRFEDGYTAGTLTLDGWERGSKLSLMEAADKIKELFEDVQEVIEDTCFHVRFGNCLSVPSGEADLFKVTIYLYTQEWKGA